MSIVLRCPETCAIGMAQVKFSDDPGFIGWWLRDHGLVLLSDQVQLIQVFD